MFSFHFLKALTAQTNHNLTLSPLQGSEHLLQKAVQKKMIPRDVQQQLVAYIFVHIILRPILGFTDKKRKQQQQYCRN